MIIEVVIGCIDLIPYFMLSDHWSLVGGHPGVMGDILYPISPFWVFGGILFVSILCDRALAGEEQLFAWTEEVRAGLEMLLWENDNVPRSAFSKRIYEGKGTDMVNRNVTCIDNSVCKGLAYQGLQNNC
jgi:hypothetical protein